MIGSRATIVGIAGLLALAGIAEPRTGPVGSSPGEPGLHAVVVPSRQATLSAPVDGVLRELLVVEGEHVKQGQILARMDDTVARAVVRSAQAAVNRKAAIQHAQYEIDLTRSYLKRLAATKEAGATTEASFDEAQARLNQAKASYALVLEQQLIATRNLELEQARLESHVLRAPFAGRIGRISAQIGETKVKTDPILQLISLSSLETELHLPATRFNSLKPGQVVQLDASAPVSRTLEARLRIVDPIIDPATRSVRCVFDLPNPDGHLPAGFTVRLTK